MASSSEKTGKLTDGDGQLSVVNCPLQPAEDVDTAANDGLLAKDRGLPKSNISPSWRATGLRYHSYNYYLRQRFGCRVQKVSIDAGFTCPNVDGTVAKGGCTFCDNSSFS